MMYVKCISGYQRWKKHKYHNCPFERDLLFTSIKLQVLNSSTVLLLSLLTNNGWSWVWQNASRSDLLKANVTASTTQDIEMEKNGWIPCRRKKKRVLQMNRTLLLTSKPRQKCLAFHRESMMGAKAASRFVYILL